MSPLEGTLAAGIVIMLSGAFTTALLLPRWALAAYFVCFALLAFLSADYIGSGLDRLHARIIRKHLLALGASSIDVKPFSNHYGVHFIAVGKKYYAKCRVMKWGRLEWKGLSAQELMRNDSVV